MYVAVGHRHTAFRKTIFDSLVSDGSYNRWGGRYARHTHNAGDAGGHGGRNAADVGVAQRSDEGA